MMLFELSGHEGIAVKKVEQLEEDEAGCPLVASLQRYVD